MKTILIALIFFTSGIARAHKDTNFSIQSDGQLLGFPAKYGPARIVLNGSQSTVDSGSLAIQLKDSVLNFPDCIFNLFSTIDLDDLNASGSWYHGNGLSRFIGLDLPPYLSLRVSTGNQPLAGFFNGYSILVNMENAKLIEVTAHTFNEQERSEQLKKVDIPKICTKEEVQQLSPTQIK